MGEIYRVDVPAGSIALKRLFEWNPGTGAETEAAFTAHARAAGVTTPIEVRSHTGELVAHVGSERYRAYTWLELDAPLVPPLAPTLLVELGGVVGRLHAIAPTTSQTVDEWYLTPPDAQTWHELSDAASDAGVEWADQLADALPALIAEAAWTVQTPPRPAYVCHRDLDPSNVLLQSAGGLAVLDWENLGPLAPQHDLGMAVLSFVAVDGDDVRQQVRHIRDGYLAAGGTVARLIEDDFAVALNTRLNFVHLQARAALTSDAAAEHRRFADDAVVRLLARPSTRPLLPDLVAGWAD